MHELGNSFKPANRKSLHQIEELTLCEMLDDPIVQDVMRSDGISRAEVLAAFRINDCRNFALAA